jgi:NhaA family Na+:H+ antiporter
VLRVLSPIQRFIHAEAAGGVLLLICTLIAMIWANSPWGESYAAFWHMPVAIAIGPVALNMDLHHWINDGLMAVFFFVVGLEIKREVLAGELSSRRQAALPVAAALGGMVVPALLYTLVNRGGAGAAGWGIPMATDIAFALGVLALLGRRAPLALKVFLTALAIVDDLGAVLVIALFYTASISGAAVGVAACLLLVLIVANRLGVRRPLAYGLLGLPLWLAVLQSGVHATIAGVLLALTIPMRARLDPSAFLHESRGLLDAFERDCGQVTGPMLLTETQLETIQELENGCDLVQTPLHRIEHALHPVVAFAIMPLFALANAGVALRGDALSALAHPAALGVLAGLVVGKPVGITLFSWLAIRLGLAELPAGVSWRQLVGVAMLGGIGFTMSLFITGLAFQEPVLVEAAKLGILLASTIAGGAGWMVIRSAERRAAEWKTAAPRPAA